MRRCCISNELRGCSIIQVPLRATVRIQRRATLPKNGGFEFLLAQKIQNIIGDRPGETKYHHVCFSKQFHTCLDARAFAVSTHGTSSSPWGFANDRPVDPRDVDTQVAHWTPSQCVKPLKSPLSIANMAALSYTGLVPQHQIHSKLLKVEHFETTKYSPTKSQT